MFIHVYIFSFPEINQSNESALKLNHAEHSIDSESKRVANKNLLHNGCFEIKIDEDNLDTKSENNSDNIYAPNEDGNGSSKCSKCVKNSFVSVTKYQKRLNQTEVDVNPTQPFQTLLNDDLTEKGMVDERNSYSEALKILSLEDYADNYSDRRLINDLLITQRRDDLFQTSNFRCCIQ